MLYWRLESAWTPKFRLGWKQVLSALEVDDRLEWKKASQISIECRLTTLIPLIGEFNPCILGCVVFLQRFTSTSKNRLPLIGGGRKGREWEERIHFYTFSYIGNNWITLISGLDWSVGSFNAGIKFWKELEELYHRWVRLSLESDNQEGNIVLRDFLAQFIFGLSSFQAFAGMD